MVTYCSSQGSIGLLLDLGFVYVCVFSYLESVSQLGLGFACFLLVIVSSVASTSAMQHPIQ